MEKKKIADIKNELGIDAAKMITPQYINYNKRHMMTSMLRDIATLKLTKISRPDDDWKRVDRIAASGQPVYAKLAKLLVSARWSASYGKSFKTIVAAKNNTLINESIVIREDFYDKRMKDIGKLPNGTLKEQVLLSLNAMPHSYQNNSVLLNSVGAVYIPELNFEDIYQILDYFSDASSKEYDGRLTYTREGQTIWTPPGETPIEITYMEMNVLKEILKENVEEVDSFERIGVYLRDSVRAYCEAARKKRKIMTFWQSKQDVIDIFKENYSIVDKKAYPKTEIATSSVSNHTRAIPLSEPVLENMPDSIKERLRPSGSAEVIAELAI